MTTLQVGHMIEMIGSRFEMVARMGDGEIDTVLFRTRMAPGKLVPLHSHRDPECFYVLTGRIDVFVLNRNPGWHPLETGGSILLADGIKHAVRNPTQTEADLVLATNGRFAAFLSEAGRATTPDAPFGPPLPDDIQRMLRVSQTYGYWNATPEEHAALTL